MVASKAYVVPLILFSLSGSGFFTSNVVTDEATVVLCFVVTRL